MLNEDDIISAIDDVKFAVSSSKRNLSSFEVDVVKADGSSLGSASGDLSTLQILLYHK